MMITYGRILGAFLNSKTKSRTKINFTKRALMHRLKSSYCGPFCPRVSTFLVLFTYVHFAPGLCQFYPACQNSFS